MLTAATTADPTPETRDAEMRLHLHDMLRGKIGKLPLEVVIDHLCTISPPDFDARTGTASAFLRRFQKGAHDKPRFRRHAAGYRTIGTPAYELRFSVQSPWNSSCSCPDYLRNGLSTCKHVLWLWNGLTAAAPKRKPASTLAPCALTFRSVRDWAQVDPLEERLLLRGAPLALAAATHQRLKQLRGLLLQIDQGTLSAEPACLGVLRLLLDEALRRAACQKQLAPHVGRALKQLKTPLLPYQQESVQRFATAGRLLLADDMGLGKTAQAIACVHLAAVAKVAAKILLIVPTALKPQWQRELATFTSLTADQVEGTRDARSDAYQRITRGIVIIGYEQFLRDHLAIRRWEPQLVVLDEAQRIKNWAAKTSQLVKTLDAPYRIVLSGTPFENRLEELASVVEWLDDSALEPKWRLSCSHTVRSDGTQPITGARNLSVLRDRLKPILMRRTREAMLPQLPRRTNWPQWVALTEAQRFEHDLLRRPILELVQRGRRRPLLQAEFLQLMQLLTRQRMISNGLALASFESTWPDLRRQQPSEQLLLGLESPKLLRFRELVERLAGSEGRKIVVFSQWRRMLELAQWAIADVLASRRLEAGFFSGNESLARRNENLIRFHDDPSMRVLFCTDAGGVGLNLQRAASCLINLEYPWNPAVLEQRVGRIHRMGQTAHSDIYLLGSSEGIEAGVARTVNSKSALFKGLFDGTSDEVPFDDAGQFLKRVTQVVEALPAEVISTPEESDPLIFADEEEAVSNPEAQPVAAVSSAQTTIAPVTLHQDLLAGLQISARPDGGLTISAPPAAAQALAQLFGGLAKALTASAARPGMSETNHGS